MANAIYNIIVNLCHTGKRIWESQCVTRYKDYVIYKTPPRKRKAKAPLPEKEIIVAEVAKLGMSNGDVKKLPAPVSSVSYSRPLNIFNDTLRNIRALNHDVYYVVEEIRSLSDDEYGSRNIRR